MPADEGLDTSRMTFNKCSLVGSKFLMYSGSLVTSTTRPSIAALRAATPAATLWGICNLSLQKEGIFLIIKEHFCLFTSLQIFGLLPGFLSLESRSSFFLVQLHEKHTNHQAQQLLHWMWSSLSQTEWAEEDWQESFLWLRWLEFGSVITKYKYITNYTCVLLFFL